MLDKLKDLLTPLDNDVIVYKEKVSKESLQLKKLIKKIGKKKEESQVVQKNINETIATFALRPRTAV